MSSQSLYTMVEMSTMIDSKAKTAFRVVHVKIRGNMGTL